MLTWKTGGNTANFCNPFPIHFIQCEKHDIPNIFCVIFVSLSLSGFDFKHLLSLLLLLLWAIFYAPFILTKT